MTVNLTEEERNLLKLIQTPNRRDAEIVRAKGEASFELMNLLINRDAIPRARRRYFTDPEMNIGGRGSSRQKVFENNGTSGDAIFKHQHFFQRHLPYFLFGPDLPASVIEGFQGMVDSCQPITSGDILPLGKYAAEQTRLHRLDSGTAAEEFYKLATETGLDGYDSRVIRDMVKRLRSRR